MSSEVVIRRRFSFVGLILFVLFLVGLVLHTLFDRVTPYTSEATLQAPVVGVAPNVSGTIVSVSVQDNQPVKAGDRLFRIDRQRFEAAVKQAEANLNDATQRVGASTAALAAAAAKVSDAKANLTNERAQTERTPGRPVPCLAINWPTLPGGTQRLLLRLIATIVVAVATLAGCSNRDCAYYGGADANTRCVVVGPAPIGAGP